MSCLTQCTRRARFLKLLRSDVGCKTVANMIKGKTPEEIRKLFNIVNDFTPEEEVRDLTCRLKALSDPLFLVLQAQIKKENVSHPPCPHVCESDSDISLPVRNGLRIVRLPQMDVPCSFLPLPTIIECRCIILLQASLDTRIRL